jgi:hypothetical protein
MQSTFHPSFQFYKAFLFGNDPAKKAGVFDQGVLKREVSLYG